MGRQVEVGRACRGGEDEGDECADDAREDEGEGRLKGEASSMLTKRLMKKR